MKLIFTILSFLITSFVGFSQAHDQFFIKLFDIKDQKVIAAMEAVQSIHCPFTLPEMSYTFLVRTDTKVLLEDLQKALRGKMIHYAYVEPVPEYEFFYTPNDLSGTQYYLTLLQAEQAWDINNNASSVKIAVIDNAVELNHPDLAPNIWTNPLEIAGNGIDDDSNGFADDVQGYDFGDNDNNPNPNSTAFFHGTHVAGLASAATDNNAGIASLGSNASIIPIKIADNTGSLVGGFQGIDYAIAIGADVINMSWGGGAYSVTYQNLFDIAYAQGIVCVAAAGNYNVSAPMYPASYNYVISVAATDPSDQKASFSNYGSSIDVAAPGVDIYSTLIDPPNSYGNLNGTSMASPIVAGLVALMRASNPLASVDDIENCLESTCDPVLGPYSTLLGSGRVNAFEAMKCITAPSSEFTSDFTQVCPGMNVQFYNYSVGAGLTFSWSHPGGSPVSSTVQNPVVTYNTPGIYDVTLTVTDAFSSSTTTYTGYIIVSDPSATINGNSTIVAGGMGSVVINFTGNPPFDITIDDGSSSYNYNSITSNPYVCYFNPTTTTTYTLAGFNDAQCNGTYSGSAIINVVGSNTCDTTTATMLKYLGTNLDDVSTGAQDLGEYGYLIMGRKNISSSSYRNYICRLDKCGNLLWEKIYNPLSYGIPVAAHMEGNEILICGYNGSSASNARSIMTRLDLQGNVLAAQDFGSNNATYPRYMEQSGSGALSIGGVTNSLPSFGGNDTYVMRNTSTGSIIWQKRIGGTGNDFLHDIKEADNGDLLTTGYCMSYFGSLRSGFICRLDSLGNLLWMNRYDMGTGQTYFTNILELNGYYYAVGRTNTGTYGDFDGLLVKVDTNGIIQWSQKVGGPAFDGLNAIEAYNDTLYVLGVSASGASSQEICIMRFDQTGNLIDYTAIGTPSQDDVAGIGKQISLTATGGFYGIGYGNGGYLGGDDLLFFKYNSYNDNCSPLPVVVQHSTIGLIENSMVPSVGNTTWNFTATTWVPEDVISNQGFVCSDINYIVDSTLCNVSANFAMDSAYCFSDSVFFYDLSTPVDTLNLNIWDFGDGSAVEADTASVHGHVFVSPGTYTVQLIAIDTLTGCSDTVSYAIDIITNPSITLADSISICAGDTALIWFSSSCLSDSAAIDWYNDSIIASETDSLILSDPLSSQYLYVSILDYGTTILDSIFIIVDSNCCNSTALISVETGPLCPGDTVYFINSSISTGGSNTYNWSFLPDGVPLTYSGITPPGVIFPSTGPKQIVLELTDSCGVFTDTLILTIFPPPSFTIGVGDTLCQSDTISLGETSIDDWIYQWSPGADVSDSTVSDPSTYIDSTISISVIVTDPWSGCSFYDTVTFAFDSVYLDILLNDTVVCIGSEFSVPYVSTASGLVDWSPSGIIANSYPDSLTLNVSSETILYGVITGNYGVCQMEDSLLISTHSALNPIDDTMLCGLQYQTMPIVSTSGFWYSTDSDISFDPDEFSSNPLITATNGGSYEIAFQDTICVSEESFILTLVDDPYAILSDTSACLGEVFKIEPVVTTDVTNWLWNDGSTNPSLNVTEPGTYTLIVSNMCNAFTDSLTVEFDVCNIYIPNVISLSSTTGNANWFIDDTGLKSYHVVILNRWGNVMFEYDGPGGYWDGTSGGRYVSEGTYYYIIAGTDINGEAFDKQGFIQVLK